MNLDQAKHTTMRSLISPVKLASGDEVPTDAVTGTVFYKQLFSYGTWINPNFWWDDILTMELDRELAQSMVDNFNNNTLGSPVAVPLNHTSDVTANTGEVIKLEVGADGLYGYLEIKKPEVVEDIKNGLIFDVSIGFDWDYVSQKDGEHYGPTLYHVALVTEPYINDMSGFTEAEFQRRANQYEKRLTVGGKASVIMMSKSKVEELKSMGKQAKLSAVKNDRDFPVDVSYQDDEGNEQTASVAAGESVEVPEAAREAVEQTIADAEAPADSDAGNDPNPDANPDDPAPDADPEPADESDTDKELSRLRAENVRLQTDKAYGELLSKGKILPAQKEKFYALAKSNAMVELAKGEKVSVIDLMSDILEASPAELNYDEKGKGGKQGEQTEVELSKEDEKTLSKLGVKPETYKQMVADGKVKPLGSEEE